MKSKHGPSWFCIVLLTGFLAISFSRARGGEVVLSAAEFQRTVYSANLLARCSDKPELDAALHVLLELQRRNVNADPGALADLSRQALQHFRSNAPAFIRAKGSRDEILAVYAESLGHVEARTQFVPVHLSLLYELTTRAQAPSDAPQAGLIHSGGQRLLSAADSSRQRRELIHVCTARAQDNEPFRIAMDALLHPETGVSLGASPAEIIGNTNSALHDNATMQTLLAVSAASGDGSVTISSNELLNLFSTETRVLWNSIHTNLALRLEFNKSQPDLLAYLTNQAAVDQWTRRWSAVAQNQVRQIASASAAILVHSQLAEAPGSGFSVPEWVGPVGDLMGGLASFAASGDPGSLISASFGIFELFDSSESPDEQIVRELGNVKTLLADLSKNVNYRFDRVDQSLTQIYETLNERFSQIEITLDNQGRQIAHLNGDVDAIRHSLVSVQTDLSRIERNLATFHALDWRFHLMEEMNLALGYETRVGTPMAYDLYLPSYVGMENVFFTHAYNRAASETLSRYATLPFGDEYLYSQLSPQGATNVYAEVLNYIKKYLRLRLGLMEFAETPLLANPQDWSAGASSWLQLAAENPSYFRRYERDVGYPNRLDAIMGKGRDLTHFFRSLTFVGTNIHWSLYTALENYYLTKFIAFNNQIGALEEEYATNNHFALGAWRQWYTAAPRITASMTELHYAPALPSIQIRRGFATHITAGQGHSLAIGSDGTIAAWGSNGSGEARIPDGLSHVVGLAAGDAFTLALQSNGRVVAWGNNTWSQTNVPGSLSEVTAITAGADYGLALTTNGAVFGWGRNEYGQATGTPQASPPFTSLGVVVLQGQPLSHIVGIAAGRSHSLALLPDGTVLGWGANSYGEATGVPSTQIPPMGSGLVKVQGQTLSNVVKIAAGGHFSLALKNDGSLIAWGINSRGQTQLPHGLTNVVGIAAGESFALALRSDGTVVGWGDNSYGATTIPIGLSDAVAVDAGGDHGLALTANGLVVAWGRINDGQCLVPPAFTWNGAVVAGYGHGLALQSDGTVVGWGDHSSGQISIPEGLTNVVSVAAGAKHSLALTRDGQVLGWGNNDYGQIDIPLGLTNIVAISAGYSHNLALRANGTVAFWGDTGWGQGNVPAGLSNVIAIAAGNRHSLALKRGGTIVGWGDNSYGEDIIPPSLSNAVAIAAGGSHSLGLRPDGTVIAWGENYQGRTNVPPGLSNVVRIVAGGSHSLALRADGSLVGWGNNHDGQLNIPVTLTNVATMATIGNNNMALTSEGNLVVWGANGRGQNVPASTWTNLVAVSGGYRHDLAITADGRVVGWGNNQYGQINTPSSLTNAIAVAAGDLHSLALKADGTVVAWGDNFYQETNIPPGLNQVVAIAAGSSFSLALKADGTVVGWGLNNYGETTSPIGLNNAVAIAAASWHSLALKADGTVLGWGQNSAGEISIPVGLNNVVAIATGYRHSLALKANGTVIGWGDNSSGQSAVPTGLSNIVAIAAGPYSSLALKAEGTVVGWGKDSTGPIEIPSGLSNVLAMAGSYDRSLFLTAGPGDGSLSFFRAQIPSRVLPMLMGSIQNTVHELNFTGSALDNAAVHLSGAKALIQAVVELGMPYTLERDEVLHGFLYGSESLMDVGTCRAFLESEMEKLQTGSSEVPQTLSEVARLRFLRFTERLNLCLVELQSEGQPEIPRTVSHTLRLLNLLRDSWESSPPPSLEIARAAHDHHLLLHGEPYVHYTLEYRDGLNTPGWMTTTITNLHDQDFILLPTTGSRRFFRAVLP